MILETEMIIIKKIMLTIVVPAYNVENYIEQCLNSLINQTDKDFQIILIDDGSTDNTASICKKYESESNGLIKYVYQENQGLGAARNEGLKYVDTPYVSFLDSDDWQDIRFVEKFKRRMESLDFEPDLIFTLPQCYNEASHMLEHWMDKPLYDVIFEVSHNISNKVLNVENCPELYCLEVNANRRIYRTDFLLENNFSFPVGVKWEDIRPHVQLLHNAKNVVALPDTGFYYRTNVSGQITAGTGEGRLDFISVYQDVLHQIEQDVYSDDEQAQILSLMCKFSFWMIDMTNIDYIQTLLHGLHGVFIEIPDKMIQAFSEYEWQDKEERNKKEAFVAWMRSPRYLQLMTYEERDNMYRYWKLHGAPSGNILSRGIQCIKDSGLKYTIGLIFRKMIKQV